MYIFYVGYVIFGYVYTDLFLFVLHCFLDRLDNIHSVNPQTRKLATTFQSHHSHPHHVIGDNHLGEIDSLIGTILVICNIYTYMTSDPSFTLFMLVVTFFGILGNLNHYYNHLEIQGRQVYKADMGILYTMRQAGKCIGLLPSAKHHKLHHMEPFNCNFNFLNGCSSIYSYLYLRSGESFYVLAVFYYGMNPVVLGLGLTIQQVLNTLTTSTY